MALNELGSISRRTLKPAPLALAAAAAETIWVKYKINDKQHCIALLYNKPCLTHEVNDAL